ncbi:hypothetical protein [Arthrobacter sp. IK3]|uniref:hypothetical protein n=1 Tax=Arthrobacter sp. IK3 TaxID=3448169 RepID=UPI003EDFCCFB
MASFNDIIPELSRLGLTYAEAETGDASSPLGDRIGKGTHPDLAACVTADGIEIMPVRDVAVVTFAGKSAAAAAEEILAAVDRLRR